MKNFRLRIAASITVSSFAASTGSFAGTLDKTAFFKNVANQTHDDAEIRLPLFSSTATSSTCDITEPTLPSAAMADSMLAMHIIDPGEPDSAALSWLENEMQMSVDLSSEPQGISPDFTCMDPPHNCPANVKSEFLPGAVCVVTSCGLGACPTCPSFIPGLAIRAWCAYGCMRGSKVVGGCFGFYTRLGNRWLGPYCFAG